MSYALPEVNIDERFKFVGQKYYPGIDSIGFEVVDRSEPGHLILNVYKRRITPEIIKKYYYLTSQAVSRFQNRWMEGAWWSVNPIREIFLIRSRNSARDGLIGKISPFVRGPRMPKIFEERYKRVSTIMNEELRTGAVDLDCANIKGVVLAHRITDLCYSLLDLDKY